MDRPENVNIGILGIYDHSSWHAHYSQITAMQGAFAEHQVMLKSVQQHLPVAINILLIRTVDDLQLCDALIIPGGGWSIA